jgi:hypothetical protein
MEGQTEETQVASEHAGSAAAMKGQTMPKDDATLSAASAGSHVELRDNLAAAALLGHVYVLSSCKRLDEQRDEIASQCWEMADAMLRNRTDRGAAPAAIAESDSDRTDKAAPRPAGGTGDTLTADEREALEIAVEYVGSAYAVEHHAKTIRKLLERFSQ